MKPTVTLIINTAQQADYLSRVLRAVTHQSEKPDELVIAEDGEDADTRRVIEQWIANQGGTCLHLTQEKAGFRRSRILNHAIARSVSDYVVFLDGDTIPHPDFVRDHRLMARRGHFFQGHRVLIKQAGAAQFGLGSFNADRRRALLAGQLQGLKHVYRWMAPFRRVLRHLDGVRGCNLGIWRDDLLRTNGYDEDYVGWGCEDLDLALRLIRANILRMDVRGRALCYHLWHPLADRTNLEINRQRLAEVEKSGATRCANGIVKQAGPHPARLQSSAAHMSRPDNNRAAPLPVIGSLNPTIDSAGGRS